MRTDCLSDRDLILLHYGEAPDGSTPEVAAAHLAACAACRSRTTQLAAVLARIPVPADPDPAVATRIAARVNERLNRHPGRRWLPALGGAATAILALVIAVAVWSPQPGMEQTPPPAAAIASMNLEDDLPDIDFLEDLELIEVLELLRQIEGV